MNSVIKKRVFWNQAGFGGLIVGGVLGATTLSNYILRDNPSFNVIVSNIILLLAFTVVPYILGRKFSNKNALWGLTFQRALAYMLVMFLLAGFIWGISAFLVFNYDVDYFKASFEKVYGIDNIGAENIDSAVKSPMMLAFGFMSMMPFFAFLPAFIISALIRRNPAIKD